MRVLNLLYELQEIASSIKFTKEPDSTVWKFSSIRLFKWVERFCACNPGVGEGT
jgi:hypothetical protein